MPENRETFQLDVAGTIATSSRDNWTAPFNGQIVGVTLAVGTAPTGAALICDLQKNGTTIFTTTGHRPSIAIAATKTAAISAAPDVASFSAGDQLTLVPTQVGSTVAGADLSAVVEYVVV